jgi:RimJ/RimL family protein N-acetyltransferase
MAHIPDIHYPLPNGETLIISTAKALDAQAMLDYTHTVAGESHFLSFGVGEFKKTLEEERAIVNDHAQAENQLFLLGILQGEIVSMLNIHARSRPRLRHVGEFGVSVLKAHWGKGIGTAMIQTMLDWCHQSGVIRKVNLYVHEENTDAMRLYHKFGFQQEGHLRRDSFRDGRFYDAYIMGLLIDP